MVYDPSCETQPAEACSGVDGDAPGACGALCGGRPGDFGESRGDVTGESGMKIPKFCPCSDCPLRIFQCLFMFVYLFDVEITAPWFLVRQLCKSISRRIWARIWAFFVWITTWDTWNISHLQFYCKWIIGYLPHSEQILFYDVNR